MVIRRLWVPPPGQDLPGRPPGEDRVDPAGSRRRGATAMEYLFVISLILVAAITTIGQLGQRAKQMSADNSAAIQKATSGGP